MCVIYNRQNILILENMDVNGSTEQEELNSNNEISDLIKDISFLATRNDPLLKVIKSPSLLIRALVELRSLVEMVEIKRSIVDQVKFLLTNYVRRESFDENNNLTRKFEGHMLHTVIAGNPGSGKTTVGMILAKIWTALGLITNKKDSPEVENIPKGNNDIVNASYRMRILDLEDKERDLQNSISQVRENLLQLQNIATDIRNLVIKIRPVSSKTHYNIVNQDHQWDKLLNLSKNLRVSIDKANKTTAPINSVKITKITSQHKSPREDSSIPKPQLEAINPIPYFDGDPKFIVATREDFIAEYLGQTAPKTRRVLESALGGVLFIDEAYSLYNVDGGSRDKFGEECLTTINEFMSLHPNEIIIIFAGYKDKLLETIFKAQAGLFRRCTWFFEIRDYTHHGLARIFTRQLEKDSWKLDANIDIGKILYENNDIILDGGGGTEKLAFFVKMEYGKEKFKEVMSYHDKTTNIHNSIITANMINNALIKYRKHLADRIKDKNIPYNMYL